MTTAMATKTATKKATKTSYPYISAPAWTALRRKFHEKPPTTPVNALYLKSVLQFDTEDAGKTLVSSLKRVGLIGDDGMMTDLAYKWRNEDQYKAVCNEILEKVYPPELRDTFHSADAPRKAVVTWFADATRTGVAGARKMAGFYLMLLEGDLAKLESGSGPKAASKQPRRVKTARVPVQAAPKQLRQRAHQQPALRLLQRLPPRRNPTTIMSHTVHRHGLTSHAASHPPFIWTSKSTLRPTRRQNSSTISLRVWQSTCAA